MTSADLRWPRWFVLNVSINIKLRNVDFAIVLTTPSATCTYSLREFRIDERRRFGSMNGKSAEKIEMIEKIERI